MSVYLPTAVVGNSRVLATIGCHGEVMGFFYPALDYAQNLREGMPAVAFPEGDGWRLTWTFGWEWRSEQYYRPESNTLTTHLTCPERAVSLTITDTVPADSSALVREYRFTNQGDLPTRLRLFAYFHLTPGELAERNLVRYCDNCGAFIQHWRSIYLGVGGSRFDQWQCGTARPGAGNSAKDDMNDGWLSGHTFDLGNVNLAGLWEIELAPGAEDSRLLALIGGSTEHEVVRELEGIRSRSATELFADADAHWRKWLAPLPALDEVPDDIREGCKRSLLCLPLLQYKVTGAFLAAPEFDPSYQLSGGYGYCWPRDAAEVVEALCLVGHAGDAEAFLHWAVRHQSPEGYWHQRYWLTGDVAPSWCNPGDALQIDQVGAVIVAMQRWAQAKGAPLPHALADSVERAAMFLEQSLDDRNLHVTAYDLWETFRGSFFYSNASLWAGLTAAAELLEHHSSAELIVRWRQKAAQIKESCLQHFCLEDRLARGFREDGSLDLTTDSSLLGLVEPYGMLDPDDDDERLLVERLIAQIDADLVVPWNGFLAVRRFVGDGYVGGPPAAVNTLWMARVLLRLAESYLERGMVGAARERVDRASGLMRVCLSQATPAGLLPELFGAPGERPYWAAPHGWCMALMVKTTLRLNSILPRLLAAEQG